MDPLTIVFALVAAVVLWKLWGLFGQRTGFERPSRRDPVSSAPASAPPASGQDNVIRLPGAARPQTQAPAADPERWRRYVEPGADATAGLDAIAAADPTFAIGPVLQGSSAAYEAINTAFASGERKTLQNLLSREVYDGFNAALLEREKTGAKLTTTIVSIEDAKVHSAMMDGRMARIAVRFLSKQISATHAADGALTDGSPDKVAEMNDLWTFARDTRSRDPNWKLVATAAGH